ncbi:MAG: hypothetical protein JWQ27_3206 [Ferruginibacter sp.]|nr:hypothetical protein [Ferruginibacter sp.]
MMPVLIFFMRRLFILLCFISAERAMAQELFVYSEPASNMSAKSIGLRLNNYFMRQTLTRENMYQLQPEIMVGLSKKIMLHGEAFFSNMDKNFALEGGSFYAKYRFFSNDDVHSHFRMAAYGKIAVNNALVHHPAIDLNGHNSGYEAGIVATQLINKFAFSAGGSVVHALDNSNGHKFYLPEKNRNAVSYNVAIGKLMLPKEYVDYNQVNVNLMLEMLGQTNLATRNHFLDLAPSVQFIFLSKMRLDIGYRYAVIKDLQRLYDNSFFVRFEYNLFNAFK